MSLYNALVLGLLQGLTEFLPISSSGHLILMERYLGLDMGVASLLHFDVILHAGSLLAILLYFSTTWLNILRRPFAKGADGSPPLLFLLIVATIPLAIIGYIAAEWVEQTTRTPLFVAFGFMFTGGLLVVSGWYESRFAGKETIGWRQAIGVSLGQALAILPGFSRSGLCIASGRLMGNTATRATEFAFMLGGPALAGALFWTLQNGVPSLEAVGAIPLFIGFSASLIASLSVMHFFLLTIRRYGVWVWSVYLFVAASLIIADEMMPLITELPEVIEGLELRIIAGILFIALLLEAIPFTSTFVPGFLTMVAIGTFLHDDPWAIAALIPIGASALIIGHLIGYIPARQARIKVHWKENANQRLTKTQHFFRKYGFWAVFFGGWWAPFRPFISIAAGLSNMRPIPYLLAIVTGSFAWMTWVMVWSAVVLGRAL